METPPESQLGETIHGVPRHLRYDESSLVDQFDATVSAFGTNPALDFLGAVTSYASLRDQVARVAEGLRRLGVGAGDSVAILLPNCPQNVVAFQAVVRLGAVAVEHNPLYTTDELRQPFVDHGAKVAVVWDKAAPVVDALRADTSLEHVITVDLTRELPRLKRFALRLPLPSARRARAQLTAPHSGIAWQTLLAAPPLAADHARPRADDTALLLYTSGTTGIPKGVPLTHRNLVSMCLQGRAWVHDFVEGRETFLVVLPMFHAYGITVGVLLGLRVGAKLVLLPKPEMSLILPALKKEVPTFLPAVPPLYARILAESEKAGVSIRGIRNALSGAMSLPADLVERWERATGGLLVEGYGLTETSPVVVGNPMSSARRPGSIGVPFPDVEVRIADPEDLSRDVAPGEPGELLVRGPQVFGGYRNQPDATASAFHEGWFRTGDVVVRSDDGFITIVDRIKEVVITGGFNVYPSEVEGVLRNHPAIADCAVVGVPHGDTGEQVVAAVVGAGEQRPDHETLREFAKRSLTAYKVPRTFVWLESLPTNPMGKVLRREVVRHVEHRLGRHHGGASDDRGQGSDAT